MVYIGMFKDQLKHGEGLLEKKVVDQRYFGHFKDDKFHGPGWL